MKKYLLLITAFFCFSKSFGQQMVETDYPKSLASYDDFKNLVLEVEVYRNERLIDFDEFLAMSKEENVVILDTRSEYRYNRKHLKGAIHLDFSDFTQENLARLIPDPTTKILIYCNNNFIGDQVDFASKVVNVSPLKRASFGAKKKNQAKNELIETKPLSEKTPTMLALNIPTFINLYGYGYVNVYELNELVNVNAPIVEFEGTAVKSR